MPNKLYFWAKRGIIKLINIDDTADAQNFKYQKMQ